MHCATENVEHSKHGRIGIVFFGLSRALELTMPTLRKMLFSVLDEAEIDYDVFWVTMVIPRLSNQRSGEFNLSVNEYDVKLMNPCRFTLINQDVIQHKRFEMYCKTKAKKYGWDTSYIHSIFEKKVSFNGISGSQFSLHFNKVLKSGNKSEIYSFCPRQSDIMKDNFGSVKNILCAQYSQEEVFKLLIDYAVEESVLYDAILAVRPDTAMLTPIDLPLHLSKIKRMTRQGKRIISTPAFHEWGGLNDRLAFGNIAAMEKYLLRGRTWTTFDFRNPETFLLHTMRASNVTTMSSSTRVVRVRANGKLHSGDTKIERLKYTCEVLSTKNDSETYMKLAELQTQIKCGSG